MKINENTILITGGSAGLGYALAEEFLALGNRVIITGRNIEKLKEAQKTLNGVETFQCDNSQYSDIQKLSDYLNDKHKNLNIIINNAGMMRTINLLNNDLNKKLTEEIDININGTIWVTDLLLPLLKKNSNTAIVNVSSGLAFTPFPVSPIYSATKAAMHSYSLSLRKQLEHINIKVFELAPPALKTEMFEAFDEADKKNIVPMEINDCVKIFIKDFIKDNYEICPGASRQLRFMSRFMPNFILSQMSKSLTRFHK